MRMTRFHGGGNTAGRVPHSTEAFAMAVCLRQQTRAYQTHETRRVLSQGIEELAGSPRRLSQGRRLLTNDAILIVDPVLLTESGHSI